MSKKKKKKKQKDRSPASSSYERNDESFKEKEYRKTKETSKREHSSDFHVSRPMQDEAGRSRQVDSLPSPKKNLAESSPRKERLYKKPVYRLGTVSHSEKEKDRNKEVKEKQSTTSSTRTLENDSKRPHCTKKSPPNPTAAGESTRKRVSEELREERKQLVKRRSKEPLESKGFVQFSLRKEHSQEPKSKPAAFKTVNVSKEPHRHSESSKPSGSTQEEKQWLKPHKRLQFKIPKKTSAVVNKDKVWENSLLRDYKRSITEKVPRHSPSTANVFSACTFSSKKSTEKAKPSCEVNPTASIFVGAFSSPSERHKESRSTDNKRATTLNSTALPENAQSSRVSSKATETCDGDQEVITELHKARSQKLLEVNVVDSYGELTRMDIDPPEEMKAFSFSTEHLHQDLLIILDTNILLSHLDFVKKMRTHGLGALGFPHILIPWVVMQELDSLKQGKLSSSVEHKARPAVHYIYTTLKNQDPRLWGQSMQQASQRICDNDKNLCSKALLSGVKALSKADLESEVERLQSDPQAHCRQPVPNCWPAHTAEDWKPSQIHEGGENNRSKAVDEEREVSTSVSVLEEALRGALSLVLESEMKAAFDDLWLEVVILKPPWTLPDLFHCFKKHWIAVFGNVIKRNLLGSVECLNDSLCKDKMVDRISINLAAREAHRLLHAFSCRPDYGKNLTEPLAVLEQLLKDTSQSSRGAEQTSGSRTQASSDGDVLMAVEEDGVSDAQPSYHEVWAVFENIWNNVCQISSAVFTALQFIPGTLETSMPSNGPPPPEEALSCLHKLIFTVRQLLESLQRVLLSKSSFEDVQGLLAFISSCEIATMKPSFTAEDLFKCLSQQEYREKLRVGGSQLMDLSSSLDCCASAVGQRAGSSSWC